MGKHYMTMSDLTGAPILDDEQVIKLLVIEHPELTEPVQLDASRAELAEMSGTTGYVIVEVLTDGSRQRLMMEVPDFEKLFKLDVENVLAGAERVRTSRKASTAGEKSNGVDYKILENAGMPHRGRVTAEEAQLVRDNLEQVNLNRHERGLTAIDPDDERDRRRYGFT